jgi:hypothetical protein
MPLTHFHYELRIIIIEPSLVNEVMRRGWPIAMPYCTTQHYYLFFTPDFDPIIKGC